MPSVSIKSLIRSGPAALAVGLFVLGASSYGFLLVSGRVLGDERYAPLGTLWVLAFLLAPAFFYPVEQEVGRAVAARRARNEGVLPVFQCAVVFTAILVVALCVLTAGLSPLYVKQLFNSQNIYLIGLLVLYVTFAMEYLLKGLLAGSGRLHAYGLLIALEGLARVVAAIAFAAGGIESAQPFAIAIGLACVVGVVVVAPGKQSLLTPGPEAPLKELSGSLGNLIAASLLSQALINCAPLVVKYLASASQQVLAGAFVKAIVITRIPVFLFQAVQAVLLPRLTHFATTGEKLKFIKTLQIALISVAVIGALGTAGAAVLGNEVLRLFGSDYDLGRVNLTLLSLGNAFFLLCMTLAQALVSVHAQTRTVIGWGVGLVGFAASFAIPGSIVTRAELALITGAAIALIVLAVSLLQKMQTFAANEIDLSDSSPAVEMIEP